MPRPFADGDLRRTQTFEDLKCGGDHRDVCIDTGRGVELDKIRLQQNALASNIEFAFPNAFEHARSEIVRVRRSLDHGHGRSTRGNLRARLPVLPASVSGVTG